MHLGVVGMLPGDFRTFEPEHLQSVQAEGFGGVGFHLPGNLLPEITPTDTQACQDLFSDHDLSLVQFSISYPECLFHPQTDIRQEIISKITAGAEIAAGLGAHYFLIRPGSLSPEGSWTPHRDNFTPESWQRLIATLKEIVPALEANDVTAVMETHLVSILKNPETCRQLIETVDSTRLRLVMDYVNHFETLSQVYASAERLDHIFAQMGPYAPVMHIKDIFVGKGLVLHLHETLPGNGELDLIHCFQHFENRFPDQFGLIEHLKRDQIPEAAANTRQICSDANVPIQP